MRRKKAGIGSQKIFFWDNCNGHGHILFRDIRQLKCRSATIAGPVSFPVNKWVQTPGYELACEEYDFPEVFVYSPSLFERDSQLHSHMS